jgi:histidinol dehydrogenase
MYKRREIGFLLGPPMKIRIVKWTPSARRSAVDAFLRRPAIERDVEETARRVLEDIRGGGDAAVLRYLREFDRVELSAGALRVRPEEFRAAQGAVDAAFRKALREADRRVAAFARRGMRRDWQMPTARGGSLGETFRPLDRVGVYIPGGTAPLVSTVVMTVTLARVARVPEIVACTPPRPDGSVNPFLLAALDAAGATEVYRLGGIPAIGAMAYGTRRVRRVQKIVGPGGAFVTAAKKCVYGDVALDLVAGPSEVAILADDSARPDFVAADLLAQAEHGTGREKALLATPSEKLATAVARSVGEQLEALGRKALMRQALEQGVLIVVVPNLADGMALCNRFAPEHFEILTRDARSWMGRARRAGAVFCGDMTPEVAGDFVAGPSHVLPTGGAAAMFSGLTVDDFRVRTSRIRFTRADLADALPTIEAFGRVEGLDAHARSARIRFEKPKRPGRRP